MTNSKFSVVLLDPPWAQNPRNNKATRFGGGIHGNYKSMTPQQLKDMKPYIDSLADKNCAMFMWATPPKLPEAIELMKTFGFSYSTIAFAWLKVSKSGKPLSRTGHYTGSNLEVVLIGIRGSMPVKKKLVNQVIISVPSRNHSEKPKEVHDRIVEMYGDVPRIELFARRPVAGWTTNGFDLDGTDYTKYCEVCDSFSCPGNHGSLP